MNYYKEIEQVIDYIEGNLHEKITTDDIIKNTYCSLPQFYRVFYHVVGNTIISYVRKRKLSYASLELINTNKSIIDITLDYGYELQQTFNRAFTNIFGVSPGRYRQTGKGIIFYPKINFYERRIQMSGICFGDVRVIALEPMKIASYHICEPNVEVIPPRKPIYRVISISIILSFFIHYILQSYVKYCIITY